MLGFWAAYRPEQAPEAFLADLARRDFDAAAVDLVMRAWTAMSRAMGHLPGIPAYYMGPGFWVPAHPLVPQAGQKFQTRLCQPVLFDGGRRRIAVRPSLSSRSRVSLVMSRLDRCFCGLVPDDPAADVWAIIENEYAAAMDESRQAWDCSGNGGPPRAPLLRGAA